MNDKLEEFNRVHQEAMDEIQKFIDKGNGLSELAKWMLTTKANPYSYLQSFGDRLRTANDFASLLNLIHYALYDDGDMTFVSVNGQPRIIFAWKGEENFREYALNSIEKDFEEHDSTFKHEVQVLNIKPEEFGSLYETYEKGFLKQCFIDQYCWGDESLERLKESYEDFFEESWIQEAEDERRRFEN